MHVDSSVKWIANEFSNLSINDLRLGKRFLNVATALMKSPTKTINQAMENWPETKAAYRLFDNDKLERGAIMASHKEGTLSRVDDFNGEVILAIQDSTTLNYTHHPKVTGLNKLQQQSDYTNELQGFHVHNLLLTTEDGIPLGLLRQDIFQNDAPDTPHKQLPITQKQSYRWLQSLRTTHELTKQGKRIITVCDREADIYEFMSEAENLHENYIIRGKNNRRTIDKQICISDEFANKDVDGEMEINVAGNGNRAHRTAIISIKFIETTIGIPQRHPNAQTKVREEVMIKVIWATEKNPPKGQKAINWILFTNCPVKTIDQAKQCLQWYQHRWRIEEFHKVMKSGCNAENCYLRTFDRISKFVALMSVIAYRLYWITLFSRVMPDRPSTDILEPTELAALFLYINKRSKKKMPDKPPTAQEVTIMIAKLGGFLGRKNDNQPGITVIWRGWQKLQSLTEMWVLMNEEKLDKRCG